MPSPIATQCTICHQVYPYQIDPCECGELICQSCPCSGCPTCPLPDSDSEREICVAIRATAAELADLKAISTLFGMEALQPGEQAKLILLTDVLASLMEEWAQWADAQDGEEWQKGNFAPRK